MAANDPYNVRKQLHRTLLLPPSLRLPAWRWSFILDAFMHPETSIAVYRRDKLLQRWAEWYRGFMAGRRVRRNSARETALAIYQINRPCSVKWMLEALLAAGLSPMEISGRLHGITPEAVHGYSNVFFNVAELVDHKPELVSTCMSWCGPAECDMLWKLYAMEHGADRFMNMVASPTLRQDDAAWFRGVLKRRVALKAADHTGMGGGWSETVDRIMSSASKWVQPELDDRTDTNEIRVMDYLSQMTVQLLRNKEEAAREFVPIPFKPADKEQKSA